MKRALLLLLGVATCVPGLSSAGSPSVSAANTEAERASLEILILGGTRFLGPHLVDAALARGHQVTLFNRGKSNPGLFPDLETLIGDRDPQKGEGLSPLMGRHWDVVIDTSGYVPRHVAASARLLAKQVKQYIFISTISVYKDDSIVGMDEDGGLATIEDPLTEKVTGETYGALKALCEKAVKDAMPGRATIVRPGLIVGPLDRSDRYTYWPVRIARGGEVLAPGTPGDLVQYIDVRDLAEWTIHLAEQHLTGTMNAVGPRKHLPMGEFLERLRKALGAEAHLTWVDAQFLSAQGVEPWSDMPMWLPPVGDYAGVGTTSNARAIAAGLTFRPLEETSRDTLAWFRTLPAARRDRLRSGIRPEREAEVLSAWHAEQKSAQEAETAARAQ